VRRVHIPKGDGKSTRPIGIPTFADKVLQRAVTMVLSAVYEQEFLDCSYGFRPGRSQHQCLEAMRRKLMQLQGQYVIELDIRDCFGSLDHGVLREFLDRRVRDGVVRRVIGKWLKAGVLESGQLSYPERGSPQGGVASPLLANIYLHEVLDVWFASTVKPVLESEAYMFRFADDAVMVFSSERDARRVLAVLPKRFAKYGLELHPEKTRLLSFVRPGRKETRCDPGQSGTFDFLASRTCGARSHSGSWGGEAQDVAGRACGEPSSGVWEWCREHRHWPVRLQQRMLKAKLLGHYGVLWGREQRSGAQAVLRGRAPGLAGG
jgi:group II intron reverse transcriptase/maturase